MSYIRISGRFNANIAVLTGSENIGNYNSHAIAKIGIILDNKYKEYEVPVITGNSLKHWHSVYLAEEYIASGGKYINEFCKKGIGLRGKIFNQNDKNSNQKDADSECEAIQDLCNDIHGFLIPEKQIKRDSLVKFSFASPIFEQENLELTSRFAETHNRVVPIKLNQNSGKASNSKSDKQQQSIENNQNSENTESMMIFKQEYSSSPLYGFNISMNLDYICKPMYKECESNSNEQKPNSNEQNSNCDTNEINLRKKSSIFAILKLLNGFGSKQARALPIAEVKELLVAFSDFPIPNIVHGSYKDYVNKSLDILKAYSYAIPDNNSNNSNNKIHVLCYNIDCNIEDNSSKNENKIEIEKTNSLADLFKILNEKINNTNNNQKT